MSASRDASTSVHPFVQAQRMEQAARGEAMRRDLINADLMHAGALPVGVAKVSGSTRWDGPNGGAALLQWLAEEMDLAGLADLAGALFRARSKPDAGGHVWRASEGASRELARQLVESINARAEAADAEAARNSGDDE